MDTEHKELSSGENLKQASTMGSVWTNMCANVNWSLQRMSRKERICNGTIINLKDPIEARHTTIRRYEQHTPPAVFCNNAYVRTYEGLTAESSPVKSPSKYI